MDSENDDVTGLKRRKTEKSENERISDNVNDSSSTDDYETFLQEFLNKRSQSNLPMFQVINSM